jgi:hypothetical protein
MPLLDGAISSNQEGVCAARASESAPNPLSKSLRRKIQLGYTARYVYHVPPSPYFGPWSMTMV